MSVEKGFGQGCGCVFGAVAAVAVLVLVLWGAGQVLCPSCHGSGNCSWCGGSGRGKLFGDCMRCGGKKVCPDCRGSRLKFQ
jgi:hypothetical protein